MLVKKWAQLWQVPVLARVKIEINSRLRTSLGRCLPKSELIQLNPKLLKSNRRILIEVLCHEAAHLAASTLNPSQAAHGKQWAALMLAAGYKPKATITVRGCVQHGAADLGSKQMFEHYCPVCRFTRVANRRVSQWKCRMCVAAGLSGELLIRERSAQRRGVA